MYLAFHAQEVYYADALDGDIINVSLQEHPDPDIDYSKRDFELPPSVKGVFFSVDNRNAPCNIEVEWSDGIQDDGGASIKTFTLTESSLNMVLSNNDSFNVSFKTDALTYQQLSTFFSKVNAQ